MFVFSFLKGLQLDEKKKLSEIYKKLAKNEIKAIEIDMYFSEEKEAEFILESYKLWQEIKKDLIEIINVVRTNWDNEFEANKGEYFG